MGSNVPSNHTHIITQETVSRVVAAVVLCWICRLQSTGLIGLGSGEGAGPLQVPLSFLLQQSGRGGLGDQDTARAAELHLEVGAHKGRSRGPDMKDSDRWFWVASKQMKVENDIGKKLQTVSFNSWRCGTYGTLAIAYHEM